MKCIKLLMDAVGVLRRAVAADEERLRAARRHAAAHGRRRRPHQLHQGSRPFGWRPRVAGPGCSGRRRSPPCTHWSVGQCWPSRPSRSGRRRPPPPRDPPTGSPHPRSAASPQGPLRVGAKLAHLAVLEAAGGRVVGGASRQLCVPDLEASSSEGISRAEDGEVMGPIRACWLPSRPPGPNYAPAEGGPG